MQSAPWMSVAVAEVGVHTYPPGQSNPRVTEYHTNTNIAGYDDKASWCSSFINWSLAQVNIMGTGSALARSWLDWGEPLDIPVPGCIVAVSYTHLRAHETVLDLVCRLLLDTQISIGHTDKYLP